MRSEIKLGISTLVATAWISVIGCGGGSKPASPTSTTHITYTIGGTVSGFTGAGLVLQDNGGDSLTVSANTTSFAFATPVASSGPYSVTVLTQPAGESCTVTNGDGIATANVNNVSVACTSLYTIGGTISGFTSAGLVLQDNGGDNLTVGADATSFTFATPVDSGSAYSVTVLTQPVGENCAVTSGSGTATANVTSVSVACTSLYAIGGTLTGLDRTGLVLQDNGGDNLTVGADATSFTFATPVASGGAYAITVLTQPANENCTVTNGTGTAVANVNNASVVCVGEWAWMGGSSSVGLNSGQAGVYGALGTPSATNLPGGREQATTWTDKSGNASGTVWLFGGFGYDSNGTGGQLNDLWKFDPTLGPNGEWTWVSGSSATIIAAPVVGDVNGRPGIYGTMGTAAPTNVPGGREQTMSWQDASGNLWLFGGEGIDATATTGYLNDLWMFNPKLGTNGEWTWMGGCNTVPFPNGGQPGVYGTQGAAVSSCAQNIAVLPPVPGGRYGGVTWTDASGNFWLFGGQGYDSTGTIGYLNDLWEYTPGTNGTIGNWTWVGGSSTVPPSNNPFGGEGGQPGVYGTLGSGVSTNNPGGRSSGTSWTDASGNFWLFGGLGADSAGTIGYLNDLWEYKPGTDGTAGQWTWMAGSNTVGNNGGQPGVYGIQGTADAADVPGARFSPVSWVDPLGNLWLFGGQGYDWTDTAGYLNDLWKYTPGAAGTTGEWTWMGGSDMVPPSYSFGVLTGQAGVYGTLGTAAAASTPGGRFGAIGWTDLSGDLWLLGGQGYDSTGAQGYLNDLWKYQP